jgi:NADP-dependent 3-hydroxy acid dehydrogenase YdfG
LYIEVSEELKINREKGVATGFQGFYESTAILADSFARVVIFAMSQPEDADVNEILFRSTHQQS